MFGTEYSVLNINLFGSCILWRWLSSWKKKIVESIRRNISKCCEK